jgi:hypothetical protein
MKTRADMTNIVIDKATNEVIACIPSYGEGFVKDGYEIITTNADDEPIFKNDNGVIKLNLTQW